MAEEKSGETDAVPTTKDSNGGADDAWKEQAEAPKIVTTERKQELLLAARADRIAWIRSAPLPYQLHHGEKSILHESHVGQHLPSVIPILSALYGGDQVVDVNEHIAALLEDVSKEDLKRGVATGSQLLQKELSKKANPYHSILVNYKKFLAELEKPNYNTFVTGLRRFLHRLDMEDDKELLASSLRSFIDTSMNNFKNSITKQDKLATRRALESFVYGHGHNAIWATLKEESKKDDDSVERFKSLGFINPKHLDITCMEGGEETVEKLLEIPIQALLSVEMFFSPYEKLQRVLKVYHGVNAALSAALNKGGGKEKLPSADDVLPTLILTLLKAKPTKILSNLRMIEVYSSADNLRGEAGYAFTNLYGALQFLMDLKLEEPENLSISPEEFRRGLEEYQEAHASKIRAKNETSSTSPADDVVERPKKLVEMPVGEVRAARLRGEQVDMDWARKWQEEHAGSGAPAGERTDQESGSEPSLPEGFVRSYSFLTTRAEDVRMSDLPQLLSEYRMLVHATETLLSQRSNRTVNDRKQKLAETQRELEILALEAELDFSRKTRVGRPRSDTRSDDGSIRSGDGD